MARVKVTLAQEASVNVVRISGLGMQAGGIWLQWQGGQPPYTLELSPQTGPGASWTPVGPAQPGETEAVVPAEGTSGFFRVRGNR